MMRPSKPCSLAVEFSLIQESIFLLNEQMTRVYVVQSEQNPFIWLGVLFVDSGIYMGSVIRFTSIIDESYPNCPCPKVIFSPIPYHPLINKETGELDTRKAFSNWNSNSHKLGKLVLFIKRVIRQADVYILRILDLLDQVTDGNDEQIKIDNIDAEIQESENLFLKENKTDLNKIFRWPIHTIECVMLYRNNREVFNKLTEEFKQRAMSEIFEKPRIFGDDKNSLLFSQWVPELHEPLRSCILAGRFTPSNLFAIYNKETDSVSFIPGSEKS